MICYKTKSTVTVLSCLLLPVLLCGRAYDQVLSPLVEYKRKEAEIIKKRFPRQIRDMIYRAIYIQPEPIRLYRPMEPKPFKRSYGWPKDFAEYLDRDVVGLETSREAAEAFYGCNTFLLSDMRPLREFVDHDQYRSGLTPCHHVQHLILAIEYKSPYYVENPYEDREFFGSRTSVPIPTNEIYVQGQSQRSEPWQHHRNKTYRDLSSLQLFMNGAPLINLDVYVNRQDKNVWDPRDIAPTLLTLKASGVKVTLRMSCKKRG